MRLALFAIGMAIVLGPGGVGAEEQRAKTTDGKEVILRDDGTWAYAEPAKKGKPKDKDKAKAGGEYKKDKASEVAYTGKRGNFSLSLVPDAWKQLDKSISPVAEASFQHAEGDVYAIVVAERIEVPLAALKKAVLDNMKKIDPAVKVLVEEKRTVNGRPVLCLTVEADVQEIPLTYHIYLYTGDEGSIQLLTWTGRKLFKESQANMEAFLNGFEVVKKGE